MKEEIVRFLRWLLRIPKHEPYAPSEQMRSIDRYYDAVAARLHVLDEEYRLIGRIE